MGTIASLLMATLVTLAPEECPPPEEQAPRHAERSDGCHCEHDHDRDRERYRDSDDDREDRHRERHHANADDDDGWRNQRAHGHLGGWHRRANRPWRFAIEAGGGIGAGVNLQLGFRRNQTAWGFGATRLWAGGDRYGWGDRGDRGSALQLRAPQAYYLFVDRYSNPRGGTFIGLKLGAAQLEISSPSDSTQYWAATIVPTVGAIWFPFGGSFFLRPWLGAAFNVPLRGTPMLGETPYHPKWAAPTGGLTLGFAAG